MSSWSPTRLLPFALALAGCYSPELQNCTVSCAAVTECGSGQVCGADGFCAEPSVAGHCNAGGPDAAIHDAAIQEANVALRITIAGRGRVTAAGIGVCDTDDPNHGDCTWLVPPHIVRTLDAVVTDHDFQGWTTANCSMQGATCTLTPVAATQVGARFK